MVNDATLRDWFCGEVLPLEPSLTSFIRRNWREEADVADLRQDIYERALAGAREGLPQHTGAFVFTVARNHLINCAKRAQIVSFQLVADLEEAGVPMDALAPERQLQARDELRRAQAGLDRLPPRCREVVRLRKLEGLSTREVSDRLGVGIDTVEKQMTLGMRALADFMLGGTGKVDRASLAERSSRKRGA
ncbi:RNA polymerase sigma factor [Sphingomonas sp.]|uniref:RNA polymerase sigma factor n=1 Tax=Sphingomonas sp. TaxID=28214 RepID=UPI001B2DD48F|nr:RNA polymerase sigma factor [Sphingomonas sp.]MBO9713304.1 RNA polymerase sigma factor [Sphingomonas sp.]